jgi:hypothetical protein
MVILKDGKVTRHTRIDELVARTSALTITLENPAPDSADEVLAVIEGITSVSALAEDRTLLRIQFNAALETEVHIGVLQALKNAGMGFKEISRGESLESKVREITK